MYMYIEEEVASPEQHSPNVTCAQTTPTLVSSFHHIQYVLYVQIRTICTCTCTYLDTSDVVGVLAQEVLHQIGYRRLKDVRYMYMAYSYYMYT